MQADAIARKLKDPTVRPERKAQEWDDAVDTILQHLRDTRRNGELDCVARQQLRDDLAHVYRALTGRELKLQDDEHTGPLPRMRRG